MLQAVYVGLTYWRSRSCPYSLKNAMHKKKGGGPDFFRLFSHSIGNENMNGFLPKCEEVRFHGIGEAGPGANGASL